MRKWLVESLRKLLRMSSPTIHCSYGFDSNGKKINNVHQVRQEKKIANKMYKEIKTNRL